MPSGPIKTSLQRRNEREASRRNERERQREEAQKEYTRVRHEPSKLSREDMSELAWSTAGAKWEDEYDTQVLQNELVASGDWDRTQRVTFMHKRVTFMRNGKLWQIDLRISHRDGSDLDDATPYEVEAFEETVIKYRKPERGNQTDRSVQRAALPPTSDWDLSKRKR